MIKRVRQIESSPSYLRARNHKTEGLMIGSVSSSASKPHALGDFVSSPKPTPRKPEDGRLLSFCGGDKFTSQQAGDTLPLSFKRVGNFLRTPPVG